MFGNFKNRHRCRNLRNAAQSPDSSYPRGGGCGLGLGRGSGQGFPGWKTSSASLQTLRDNLAQKLEDVDALLNKSASA